ncbi:MAG TPA: IS481 family transposase [Oceanithermus profundus]|uniref:IS481 family transposase n=1 Tax=Oceanithermus profundus TaxID=187137 RepID=A0A7C4VLH4_9DEIN|nr:IS481 family transposase [Oceanithermus profundus]
MNSHKNARLTFEGRRILVSRIIHEGLPVREAAKAQGVSPRTAYKWLRRFREEGETGLYDYSSRPHRSPRRTPGEIRRQVVELRRRRWPYHAIAFRLNLSKGTVGRILRDEGLNRLSVLEPKPPPKRFEVKAPGVLLHLDTKKLARFKRPGHRVTQNRKDRNRSPGWSYVFAAVDDHSRLAYGETKDNERKEQAAAFLLSALRYYRRMGIRVRAVMTDNARVFQSGRFQRVLRWLGIQHKTTPPYTPRVNGKVERFIRTLLNEWAYAHAYPSSEARDAYLPQWLHYYNWHRPHCSLGNQAPVSRLGLSVNNVVRLHS